MKKLFVYIVAEGYVTGECRGLSEIRVSTLVNTRGASGHNCGHNSGQVRPI